jgi:hypothetical protein
MDARGGTGWTRRGLSEAAYNDDELNFIRVSQIDAHVLGRDGERVSSTASWGFGGCWCRWVEVRAAAEVLQRARQEGSPLSIRVTAFSTSSAFPARMSSRGVVLPIPR